MSETQLPTVEPDEVLDKLFTLDPLRLNRKDKEFIANRLRAQREQFLAQEAAGTRKRPAHAKKLTEASDILGGFLGAGPPTE